MIVRIVSNLLKLVINVMMWKHIKFLSDLSRQVENENVFEKKKFVRYWTLFFRIYGWFLCSLCQSIWQGCWRKDKNIDTREACWVSAVVSGHGGIGEEDRALSCLPVHALCFHNCPQFVVAFVSWKVLPVSQLGSLINLVVGVWKSGSHGGLG